jgi:hypothetical protein
VKDEAILASAPAPAAMRAAADENQPGHWAALEMIFPLLPHNTLVLTVKVLSPKWRTWVEQQLGPRRSKQMMLPHSAAATLHQEAYVPLWALQQPWLRLPWHCWKSLAYGAAACGALPELRWMMEQGFCSWVDDQIFDVAVTAGQADVVRWLVDTSGGNEMAKTYACTPAAQVGDFDLLKWLRGKGCPWSVTTMVHAVQWKDSAMAEWALEEGCPFASQKVSKACAAAGNLNMLKQLRARGCPLDKGTIAAAAEAGNLEVLQWLKEELRTLSWTQSACEAAAQGGHLEILQWLRRNSCCWDEGTCTAAAAADGHLELLQWAVAEGCPWDKQRCLQAACGCASLQNSMQLEVLKWVGTQWPRWNKMIQVCTEAVRQGNLEALQWAHSNGCPWEEADCVRYAAERNHLHVLKWLVLKAGCHLPENTCLLAAKNGNLEMLQWARGQGCPWDEETCAAAARRGHLELLQWARSEGCPWGPGTCSEAAYGGHFDVLKWAHSQGCPWDVETAISAAGREQYDVLRWVVARGCPCDERVCREAAVTECLEMLQFAREELGCPWDSSVTWAAAENGGCLEVLRWAVVNGCPWDKGACYDAALVKRGQRHLTNSGQEMMKWIEAQP